MYPSAGLVSLTVLVLLSGLILTGGIVLFRVQSLSLAVSNIVASFSFILPLFTAAGVTGYHAVKRYGLDRRGFVKSNLPWFGIVLILVTVVYDTIIATLAVTYIAPASNVRCQLESRWTSLFSSKDAEVIRRIQDRHQCCGLFNSHDRAWPFPDRTHTARACLEAFGRDRGCFAGWRRDQQITGGLILLIAIVAFLTQLLSVLLFRLGARGNASAWEGFSPFASNEIGHTANAQRLIEDAYHDDPTLDGQNQPEIQSRQEGDEDLVSRGPAVQPSQLQQGNEWG